MSRTDVDDPTNLDGPHDVPELVPGQRSAYNLLGELEIIYGQKDWRAQHIAQLEDVYTESQCLRHVRVLEWLPIRHARSMSRTEVSVVLRDRFFATILIAAIIGGLPLTIPRQHQQGSNGVLEGTKDIVERTGLSHFIPRIPMLIGTPTGGGHA